MLGSVDSLFLFYIIFTEQINFHTFFLITFTAAAQGRGCGDVQKHSNRHFLLLFQKPQLKQAMIKTSRGQ